MPRLETARARLASHPLPDNPWVSVNGDTIVIRAGYTEAIEHMLRWVPKARYSGRQRCWLVPLTGLELVRSVLPELSRLAEAMHGAPDLPDALDEDTTAPDGTQARQLFRDCARLLYGSDWQRETARALGRDEAALARWVVGEDIAEADPQVLLRELAALMAQRATLIGAAAERLAARLD